MLQTAQPRSWDDELTVILPTRGWRAFDLVELLRRAELLRFLIWRDLKVRYQQTLLGGLWAILQPLAGAAVFTLVSGRLARVPSEGVPYPLFALTGLVIWTFFTGALGNAVGALVNNRQLVSKVYFPRLILPLSAALGGLTDSGSRHRPRPPSGAPPSPPARSAASRARTGRRRRAAR